MKGLVTAVWSLMVVGGLVLLVMGLARSDGGQTAGGIILMVLGAGGLLIAFCKARNPACVDDGSGSAGGSSGLYALECCGSILQR